jgi:predicted nucleotidyltransferase
VAHRPRHGKLLVDFVPFGALETADRTLAWPPDGAIVMDVFGFQEALRAAIDVRLPGDVATRVVSLPALALLKLVCWKDRHQRQPNKDAADLQLILGNYLNAGNADRLWSEFVAWTQEEGFDYDAAGARMLGHDIGRLVDAVGRERLADLLSQQTREDSPGRLPRELDNQNPERAIRILAILRRGILEAAG